MTERNGNELASRRRGGVTSASYATEPDSGRRQVELSISVRTILLVLAAVALAWAVTSVADVLLVILVSMFSVAVLLPVVEAMERSGSVLAFGALFGLVGAVMGVPIAAASRSSSRS